MQFITSELTIQISQYVAKYDRHCVHAKSQTEEEICLSVVRPQLRSPIC